MKKRYIAPRTHLVQLNTVMPVMEDIGIGFQISGKETDVQLGNGIGFMDFGGAGGGGMVYN